MSDLPVERTLATEERFDFGFHREFLGKSRDYLACSDTAGIVVDMSRTRYIDSSALGMLIQLKKKCDAAGKALAIAHPQGAVKDTLEIANIHKLIPIR